MAGTDQNVEQAYQLAKERYAALGVDTDKALAAVKTIPISLHCWQGDDVGGFEKEGAELDGGGIQVTGNYPGKARTADELQADLEKALSHLPGQHRLNLHALYGDHTGGLVDRDKLEVAQFQSWIDWCKSQQLGLDFNPSFFSHPKADDGLTLSHPDSAIRQFWIDHGKACRAISAEMGKQIGSPCVMNIWVPDGYKDIPVDRFGARQRLKASLDAMCAQAYDKSHMLDAVECKLFGIGSESCVVGSHEFYMGYAMENKKLLCLDAGHFHPTEVISDKISSILTFIDEILLHVSRPVRWDSDHVVILSDELQAIAHEIVCNKLQDRVHIGLDFFDATINRIAAWVIGTRSMSKALLMALLEPFEQWKRMEEEGDYTSRLALTEEQKTMPFSAVWDYYCLQEEAGVGSEWFESVKAYEKDVLSKR